MKTIMSETFAFAAAHYLPTFPDGHKCRRVHGHLWEVDIHVAVDIPAEGYAFDHAHLHRIAAKHLVLLDHHCLNAIEGLERGLAEDVLGWLVARLQPDCEECGGALTSVSVHELSSGGSFQTVRHTKTWNRVPPEIAEWQRPVDAFAQYVGALNLSRKG